MIRKVRLAPAALALLAVIAACGTNAQAGGGGGGSSSGMSVSVTAPAKNATVQVPFDVAVAASVPLGPTASGKHHVHVWFDGNEADYLIVESPTVRIDNLAPGPHTLHVSLRNANHSPAGAETEVPITVGAGGATAPATSAAPGPDTYGY